MTIDWQLPVETTEDPPRPVRVLATDGPGDFPVVTITGDQTLAWTAAGDKWASLSGWQGGAFTLRNVPAKPVLYEKWLALYADGGCPSQLYSTKEYCESATLKYNRVEVRRIVWNSDGSPVERDHDDAMEIAALRKERDDWKAKAKALQAKLVVTERGVCDLLDEARESQDRAEALKSDANSLRTYIVKALPVVDAAVAWTDGTSETPVSGLVKAVRAYQNSQHATSDSHEAMTERDIDIQKRWDNMCAPQKTAEEAVANVAEMMGPVKNCTTCKHGPNYKCKVIANGGCNGGGYSGWEAKP